MSVLDDLKRRGFIENQTHDTELDAFLEQGAATCYVGFDPTADSLHIGHLIPIMLLTHMQKKGHRPIVLVGGGTGMIGDPSGKSEIRKMMSLQRIEHNVMEIKKQLSRFIHYDDGGAILVNNVDWLASLEYIPFLRDVGRHFSINRMIKAETYRQRIESKEGLSFIEFNYMLLQAYDFLMLFDRYDCRLQIGGSEQWANILAGADLIRKSRRETVFGMTFPLLTKSDGSKMGKSVGGAVWLSPEKTSPYEYYQFWINTDDKSVAKYLSLFTFLPLPEIEEIKKLSGSEINSAKTILAYEATRIAHGVEKALEAHAAAIGAFGNREIPPDILPASTVPRGRSVRGESLPMTRIRMDQIAGGIPAYQLFHRVGLARSAGEARRFIGQGGAYINGMRISAFDVMVGKDDVENDEIILRAGKKRYHRIKVKS